MNSRFAKVLIDIENSEKKRENRKFQEWLNSTNENDIPIKNIIQMICNDVIQSIRNNNMKISNEKQLKMKSQLLYIREAMSNYNIGSEDENIDPVDYLKSLDLEDFLNNKTTKDILIIEHYNNFQSKLKPTLKKYI